MNKLVLLLSPIFLSAILFSCSATKPTISQQAIAIKKDTLQATTQQPSLLDNAIFNNAQVGICVYEPATNTYLYNYQSNKYFVPASNTKIATCYAAMKYLGDSILGLKYYEEDSTITIEGTGDPTFLHKDFVNQRVLEKLKQYKNVYLLAFPLKCKPLGKGWAWDDFEEPFMAERSYFPAYGNLIKISMNEDSLNVLPNILKKNVRLLPRKLQLPQNCSLYKIFGENYYKIDRKDFKNKTLELPFSTSINTSLEILNDTLHNVSFPCPKGLTTDLPKVADNKLYSQPTDSLLKPMMHNSDNFFAEQTLLMVSLNQLGFMSDEKIIDTLLKTDFKNLPQKPKWVDGSGLSRYNLFTPQDFVFILNKMKNEFSWKRISTIFPRGDQGTLKGYYKKYHNKIFAKTGTISNNLALSGFIKANSGKDYIFSILINNHQSSSTDIRLAIEKFISSIIENK